MRTNLNTPRARRGNQAMRLLVVALVLMLAFGTLPASATPPEGTEAQGQPTRFRSIYVEHDATIAGNLTTSGDITLGDDLSVPGDLKVGNGTPTVTQDGEDAYVEGQFEVDGEAQFDGAIDANGTVQIDGATTFGVDGTGVDVRFYSDTAGDYMLWDESEEALTITGTAAQDALNIDDGNVDIADDVDVDGATTLGTLVVEGTSNLQGNLSDSGGVLTVADNVAIAGAADAIQLTVTGYTTQTQVLQTWEASGGADVATMSGAGALDVDSTLNYGTNNLYPLGYASSGYQIECGTTAAFTATTTVVATELTTVTVPLVTQVTAPAATAAYLTATDPTTAAVTIASFGADYNAGTTPVAVHYCFVGQE